MRSFLEVTRDIDRCIWRNDAEGMSILASELEVAAGSGGTSATVFNQMVLLIRVLGWLGRDDERQVWAIRCQELSKQRHPEPPKMSLEAIMRIHDDPFNRKVDAFHKRYRALLQARDREGMQEFVAELQHESELNESMRRYLRTVIADGLDVLRLP